MRNLLLLAASYWIYAWIDGRFLGLLLASTLVTYCIGLHLPRTRFPKLLLAIGLAASLGVLAYFKYTGFFLAIPLGLSFYTFQAMGYLIDVRRGNMPSEKNLLNFALFMAFFPKIVAGPIERASHFLPQLRERRSITFTRVREGTYLIVWGLLKKFVIADGAAVIANAGFQHPTDPAQNLWIAALAFTLQIYADFSGYSDIAKGAASLLGFDLVWNFHLPYLSSSPQEFWKRWHISLSEWLRDYVYIPLGGSRRGAARTVVNTLCTMALVGLWHGGTWTYVLWGTYQGALIVAYRTKRVPCARLFSVPFFFLLTVLGWILFRSETLADFWVFLSNLGRFGGSSAVASDLLVLWLPIIAMEWYQARKKDLLAMASAPAYLQTTFYIAAAVIFLLLLPSVHLPYLYETF